MPGVRQFPRHRLRCLTVAVLVVPLGLAARRWHDRLPQLVGEFAPDTLWATMVYPIIASLAPRRAVWQIAIATLMLSFAVEFSQLYHATWIDRIRASPAGALVLGRTFLPWQLGCYTAGVAIGALLDWLINLPDPTPNDRAST